MSGPGRLIQELVRYSNPDHYVVMLWLSRGKLYAEFKKSQALIARANEILDVTFLLLLRCI